MEDFVLVKTLRAAIYGHVALVRHRVTNVMYAMKIMSLAHMAAQRAVVGPIVCEDGDVELGVLRRLSGNRMLHKDDYSESVHPTWGRSEPPLFDHHHILTLYTDFIDPQHNTRCLVLEYCPYGELYDQLQCLSTRTLPVRTARVCFKQIVTAIRYIHAHNIAHRDLSLENVLVDAQRQCRVGDFGLASETGTECSGRVGKPFYMAPEVYDWQPDEVYNGLQADMWSLGILLFVLTTGTPPFEASHEIDARFRVVQTKGLRELLVVWKLDETLPFELCELLEALLRVDPNDRIDIEGVWRHPWLQGSDDGGWDDAFFTMDSRTENTRGQNNGRSQHKEPQLDEETEVVDQKSTNGPQRKRLKIAIESEVEGRIVPTDRMAGFFGGSFIEEETVVSIGRSQEHSYNNEASPDGLDQCHIQPTTSSTTWSKVGIQATNRSLFERIDRTLENVDQDQDTNGQFENCDPPRLNGYRHPHNWSPCISPESPSTCSSDQVNALDRRHNNESAV